MLLSEVDGGLPITSLRYDLEALLLEHLLQVEPG